MSWMSRVASVSSGQGNSSQDLPLIDCMNCGIPVIRISSKKPGTLGQVFYKCPNNNKDDPTSCPLFKSEIEYRFMVERRFAAQRDPGMAYRRQDLEGLRHDINQLKLCVLEMRQEIRDMRKRVFVVDKSIAVACVACFLGIILGMMCNIK